jgi:hypothetical protein
MNHARENLLRLSAARVAIAAGHLAIDDGGPQRLLRASWSPSTVGSKRNPKTAGNSTVRCAAKRWSAGVCTEWLSRSARWLNSRPLARGARMIANEFAAAAQWRPFFRRHVADTPDDASRAICLFDSHNEASARTEVNSSARAPMEPVVEAKISNNWDQTTTTAGANSRLVIRLKCAAVNEFVEVGEGKPALRRFASAFRRPCVMAALPSSTYL